MANSNIFRIINNNPFIRNVGILTLGTIAAQGITVLALPILTRIYTPQDFSLLAVYMAVLSVISVISCLRYNIAIPLPEEDVEAISLLMASLLTTIVLSVLLGVVVFNIPGIVSSLLGTPEMTAYLWMIPLGVFVASTYNALQYWASRKKRFGLVTKTRVSRAIGGTSTQLGIGVMSPSAFGLIFGHMIYGGLGVYGLTRSLWREDRKILKSIGWRKFCISTKNYRRFPLYSVPEALFNTAGAQLPIIIVAAVAAGPEAGFLMLAMRVMGLPMSLLGSSISQVYLAEAPDKLRDGSMVTFTIKTIKALLKIGGLPIIFAGLVSPFLFPMVFGEDWARAGIIVAWLTPFFVLQFVSSPISVVLHVTGKLATAMILQAVGLCIRVGAVIAALYYSKDWMVECYALSSAVFYFLYLVTIIFILKGVSMQSHGAKENNYGH